MTRAIIVLALLFLFLMAIEMMGTAFEVVGKAQAKALFVAFDNPFAGLFVGILATVCVQSSSATTSMIVGLVGSNQLPLETAVPMVMGANIGTTVTNTLVSLAHITQRDEFRRAFAGATVHDFFNFLTVIVLFPLEWLTGYLQKTAVWLSQLLPKSGGKMPNPLKESVQAITHSVEGSLSHGLGLDGWVLSCVLVFLAIGTIFFTLIFITRNMKLLVADQIEVMLNKALEKSPLIGLVVGILITVMVQSSSITTSLLIPLFAAGVLRIHHGLPLMIGANIGTTITALLASLVKELPGLQIALVHLLFNLSGMAIFFPIRPMRNIPIWCAEHVALQAVRNRWWVFVYVGVFFVGIPLLGIGVSKLFTMW